MVAAMNGMIMMRQDDRGGEDAGAERGAREQAPAIPAHCPSVSMPGRLDIRPHDGHQHEEAPHAVDDGRHGGQKFDRRAHRPAHPGGRQFGQEEGDPEGERHRHDERQDGGNDRAIDRDRGAEVLCTGSQSALTRKHGPNARKAGNPPTNKQTMIAPSSTSTNSPDAVPASEDGRQHAAGRPAGRNAGGMRASLAAMLPAGRGDSRRVRTAASTYLTRALPSGADCALTAGRQRDIQLVGEWLALGEAQSKNLSHGGALRRRLGFGRQQHERRRHDRPALSPGWSFRSTAKFWAPWTSRRSAAAAAKLAMVGLTNAPSLFCSSVVVRWFCSA